MLSGGELAAMVVMDAVLRKLPGALGHAESALEESFSQALGGDPEYPHYTRPAEYRGWKVPPVLLSGHHEEIAQLAPHALPRARRRRPDRAPAGSRGRTKRRVAAPTRSGRCPTRRSAVRARPVRADGGRLRLEPASALAPPASARLRYHHSADARSRSPRLLFAMSTVIESLERAQLRRVPSFQAGDRVRVHFQVIEGTRRRTQVFEGVVIKRQGHGVRETFTVRKQSFGVGVERTFPVHSPKIEKIEVAARGDVRRAKLYYLRDRVGKAARVRERRYVGPEEVVEAGLLHDPAAQLEAEAAASDGAVDAEGASIEEVVPEAEAVEAADAPAAEATRRRRGHRRPRPTPRPTPTTRSRRR